jgi:phage major head subunit gpT-like protein
LKTILNIFLEGEFEMKKIFSGAAALAMLILFSTVSVFAGTAQHVTAPHLWMYGVPVLGMVVNSANLSALFTTFKTIFSQAFEAVTPQYDKVALTSTSTTAQEIYVWLEAFPKLREWIGEREINNIKQQDWTIKNKEWESTIAVPRAKIEDDQYGVFSPLIKFMGASTKVHPDEIVFSLLNDGFTAKGYDGKTFFATDHAFGSNKGTGALSPTSYGAALAAIGRIKDAKGKPLFNGSEQLTLVTGPELEATARAILNNDFISVTGGSTQNNVWKNSAQYVKSAQITSATAWYIVVNYNGLLPLVYQMRKTPEFIQKIDPNSSDHVFMQNEFLYGVYSRDNAGYGLPQLAYGSTGAV